MSLQWINSINYELMINTASSTFVPRIKRIIIKLYMCKNYQRTGSNRHPTTIKDSDTAVHCTYYRKSEGEKQCKQSNTELRLFKINDIKNQNNMRTRKDNLLLRLDKFT